MSARPKLERRPFKVEMKVPMSTAVQPSQGMVCAGAGGAADAVSTASVTATAPSRASTLAITDMPGRSRKG